MPVVSVGEAKLSYERSGPISDRSGPPLLLIMGMTVHPGHTQHPTRIPRCIPIYRLICERALPLTANGVGATGQPRSLLCADR